jgi:lactate dehydrogenase-like 2-hydroxyacid dehydrogenase
VRCFVTRRLAIDAAETAGSGVDFTTFGEDRPPTEDELAQGAADARAIVTQVSDRIDRSLLARLPRLELVAQAAVGYDNVDVAACRERGVMVTHTPDTLTESVADLAMGLLLAAARRFVAGEALVRSGGFRGFSPTLLLGTELDQKTIGIVGYGRIGRAVARRAVAFGMRAVASTRSDEPFAPDGVATHAPFSRLLRESDVVTLHVPGTPTTRHLLGETELRTMRRGALLVNTSRGTVVDEAALVRALADGHLGGAGLDVYEEEPKVHPGLVARDDVVLLPHLGSATVEARTRMAAAALTEVARLARGESPRHPVPELRR